MNTTQENLGHNRYFYLPEDIDEREEDQPGIVPAVNSEVHNLYTSLRDGTFFRDRLGEIFQEAALLPVDERKRYILNKLDVLSNRTEEAKLLESIAAATISVEKINEHLEELLIFIEENYRLKSDNKRQLRNKISAISQMLNSHLERARASAPYYESFVQAVRFVIKNMSVEKVEALVQSRFDQFWSTFRTVFTPQSGVATVATASIAFSSLPTFSSQEVKQPAWMNELAEIAAEAGETRINLVLDNIKSELNALKPLLGCTIDEENLSSQIESFGIDGTNEIISDFRERKAHLNQPTNVESQVEQLDQTEIPESILNIPIRFVSLRGEEVLSEFTLGQVAAEAGVDLPSLVQSLNILNESGLTLEVFDDGANLQLIIMTPQGETPTMEQLVESLANHRFLHFELRRPVIVKEVIDAQNNTTANILHEQDNVVFTSAGEAPMYIAIGQFFAELQKVQEQEGIETFSTTRENSELVPDYQDEIVRLIDTTTQQTTVIFDIKALREQRGTYGPGVINILNGNGYGGILRDADGAIRAMVTPEGVEVPFQTEGSVRIAKREVAEMTSALRDAMNASRPAGTESSEIFVLDYDYHLSTRLDSPSAPRYKWVNEGWQDQHLGRDKYDAMLPGGNISLLTRQFGDRIIGWNQEVMGYERNDGKIFYPGLGTTEQNGSYDASDLEDGWVTITEHVQSSNYAKGESGLKLVIGIAENHPVFGDIHFDDRMQQEQIDIVLNWILERYPRLNGKTISVHIITDDVSSHSGYAKQNSLGENILDINVLDMFASGETSIPEAHTLLSRLSVTLRDIEITDLYFGHHFFGALISSIDEYTSRAERPIRVPMKEIRSLIARSLKQDEFDFMVAERK